MNWLKFWSRAIYATTTVNLLFSLLMLNFHGAIGWLLALIMEFIVYSREAGRREHGS